MTTTNDEAIPMGEAGKHPAGPGTGGMAQNMVGGAADALQRSSERGDTDAVAVASTGNAVGAETPRVDRGGQDAPGSGPGAIGAPTPGDPNGQRRGGGSVGAMGDGTSSGGSAIGATSAESAGSAALTAGSTGAGGGSSGTGGATGSLDAHAASGASVTGASAGSTTGGSGGNAAGPGGGQGSAQARAAASADRSAGAGSRDGGIDDAHGFGGGPAGSAHPPHVGDVTGSGTGAETLGPADAKRDEGPLESLGRAVSEVVTGPVDDAPRDRLKDGSSGRD
ncbi:hypothetical protein [Piscinibacter koreensis]|uniref:Uncharacterized protein n=1 Tax=Piscinibacter koreensis TaxID=2742824 RepID=A0A7Y6TWB4_9BURK|nr:hypothetical protein [Schlegelella koreensis]NUZ05868.1 hypothetical protein [Schlegelella koreensis]